MSLQSGFVPATQVLPWQSWQTFFWWMFSLIWSCLIPTPIVRAPTSARATNQGAQRLEHASSEAHAVATHIFLNNVSVVTDLEEVTIQPFHLFDTHHWLVSPRLGGCVGTFAFMNLAFWSGTLSCWNKFGPLSFTEGEFCAFNFVAAGWGRSLDVPCM